VSVLKAVFTENRLTDAHETKQRKKTQRLSATQYSAIANNLACKTRFTTVAAGNYGGLILQRWSPKE